MWRAGALTWFVCAWRGMPSSLSMRLTAWPGTMAALSKNWSGRKQAGSAQLAQTQSKRPPHCSPTACGGGLGLAFDKHAGVMVCLTIILKKFMHEGTVAGLGHDH